MTDLTAGELLAIYAILTAARAPGAQALAARVLTVYETTPRKGPAS